MPSGGDPTVARARLNRLHRAAFRPISHHRSGRKSLCRAAQDAMDTVSDVLQKRHDKIESLKRSGVNLYPNDFRVTHDIAEIHALVAAAPETLTEQGPRFTIAGRLMAVNHFGKAAFVRVRDRSGQLQAYVRKDRLGEEAFALFKQLDIGDFAGLTGTLFQTRTGEWTMTGRTRCGCCPSPCGRCRRNSTGSRTRRSATASATST